IVELQNRIQELQREQAVAQNALAQQSRALSAAPEPQPGSVATSGAPQEHTEDLVREERKKREYLSLFASNGALKYREGAEARAQEPAPPAPAPSDTARLAELFRSFEPATSASAPKSPVPENKKDEEQQRPAAASPGVPASATGKTYVLFEGTVLET